MKVKLLQKEKTTKLGNLIVGDTFIYPGETSIFMVVSKDHLDNTALPRKEVDSICIGNPDRENEINIGDININSIEAPIIEKRFKLVEVPIITGAEIDDRHIGS